MVNKIAQIASDVTAGDAFRPARIDGLPGLVVHTADGPEMKHLSS